MNEKFPVDVKQFADMFDIEESTAYGVLRFLAEKNIVETTKRPQPQGKKGKPATIFLVEVPRLCNQLGTLLASKFEQIKPELLDTPAANDNTTEVPAPPTVAA